jgi:hypothetical protein
MSTSFFSRYSRLSSFLFAYVLIGAFLRPLNTASAQSVKTFDKIGYIQTVTPSTNTVTFESASNLYQIDTRSAHIHLLTSTSQSSDTGDLVPGMRVEISGHLDNGDLVAAAAVQVLPYVPPSGVSQPESTPPTLHAGDTLKFTGTVKAVDTLTGQMTIRVGGHYQLLHVSRLTILQSSSGELIALKDFKDGDRVRLTGVLTADATLRVAQMYLLTQRTPAAASIHNDNSSDIQGFISGSASFFSRNLKVETATTEIKVKVPKGIPVILDGAPVSIHKLKSGTKVDIVGSFDQNQQFNAQRVAAFSATLP